MLAYFAGFFDGEGCVRISKRRNGYSGYGFQFLLTVNIHNTNPLPLKQLSAVYGGTVYFHPAAKSNYKPCYGWNRVGRDAYKFLKDIFPWLLIKREVAAIGIFFFENKRNYCRIKGQKVTGRYCNVPKSEWAWREQCQKRISRFNERGLSPTEEAEKILAIDR